MRYKDLRVELIKRTNHADPRKFEATPRMLSPFIGGEMGGQAILRAEVKTPDIMRPNQNRSYRRAQGRTRIRRRLRDTLAPHPHKQKMMAHRYNRELIRQVKRADKLAGKRNGSSE